MRRLIIIIAALLLVAACGSMKPFMWERSSENPQFTVDSLTRSFGFTTIPMEKWESTRMVTSDSTYTDMHLHVVYEKRWRHTMTVTEMTGQKPLVRYRRERK